MSINDLKVKYCMDNL